MKLKTKQDILNDSRIESLDCYSKGHWCASTKKEYWFNAGCRTSIGTIKEICRDMEGIEKAPVEYQYD